ncbi:MAG: ABC transporter ATP-binding protein [bacterium]|nr:ABC transporter ATP-binding protein [bacterium]
MKDNPVIKVKDLTKKFGKFTAVDSISFEVRQGEIYGFLGANGAGKSTTIKMLCGLLEPFSGQAEVAGFSIRTDTEQIKRHIGYMSQRFSLYNNLTVEENLTFYAGIYGLSRERIKKRMDEVIVQTELMEYRSTLVSIMPGGLKQRVALANSLLHQPRILFLDEPTAGVDPILRRRFWEIIDELSTAGTTVFVTTHYMDEVEHCHRLALMHQARIIEEGTIQGIKTKTFIHPLLEIETDDVVKAYAALYEKKDEIGEISIHGAMVHIIPGRNIRQSRANISRILKNSRIRIKNVTEVHPTMEDVFVTLIRRYEQLEK